MGQYHITMNYTKKEYVHPHRIGLGLKMGEQVGDFHATMGDILFLLVACSHNRGGGDVPTEGIEHVVGRWTGDRIVVFGDYSEQSDLPNDIEIGELEDAVWGNEPDPDWTDISDEINLMIEKLWGFKVTGGGWKSREFTGEQTYLGPYDVDDDGDKPALRPDMIF